MTYVEKLKDPRWQRLRETVFYRDNRTCRDCGSTEMLQCHHLTYKKDREPWDYPIDNFLTLCKECHEEITDINETAKESRKHDPLPGSIAFIIENSIEEAEKKGKFNKEYHHISDYMEVVIDALKKEYAKQAF